MSRNPAIVLRDLAKPRVAAILVLVLAPLALLIVEVARLGVNTPFSDEWNLVPLLHRATAGTLGIGNLWAQHNEHRSFFPNLLLLTMARSTHWDLRWELAVNVLLGVLLAAMLVTLSILSLRRFGWRLAAIMGVAAAWFALSPTQWENWLWGWDVSWFLTAIGAVASVLLLMHRPRALAKSWTLGLAIAAAVLSSYSLANGLIVWVAGGVALAAARWSRPSKLAWWGAAMATGVLFFIGYRSDGTSLTYLLGHLASVIEYLLVNLGAPVLGSNSTALNALLGAGLLVAFAGFGNWLARHQPEHFRAQGGWLALGLFGVLSAGLTAVGRSAQGPVQADSSRYVTLATLFLLSTLALALTTFGVWAENRRMSQPDRTRAQGLAAVALAAVLATGYHAGFRGFDYRHEVTAAVRYCLVHATTPTDPCLTYAYPLPGQAWEWLAYLRHEHLAGLTSLSPGAAGAGP